MTFQELLNHYIEPLELSGKELAEQAGISPSLLSLWRSGKRLPKPDSEPLKRLAECIAALLPREGAPTGRELLSRLQGALQSDPALRVENLNLLLDALGITSAQLSRQLRYDASYVSRIRNGRRQPADTREFTADISRFVVRYYAGENERSVAARLIGCSLENLEDESVYHERLVEWLTGGVHPRKDPALEFLQKLDSFDLNEYIKAIHFDEMKVPGAPFQLPTSKSYFGLKQMMDSELDFLKATVLSRSMEPVVMYSDMPMEEMAKDPEFPKKWMFGMVMMLKKGLHLHQIHSIDRSFADMMLGLEGWIPMYMTGQISPYYLSGVQNNVFLRLLKVSGSAALAGEAVSGHHANGKYYLTKQKDEVAYYKRLANDLLKKALPLMEIYREDSRKELGAFLIADAEAEGARRSILSVPPVYTMSEDLLMSFLEARAVPDPDKRRILDHASAQRQYLDAILAHSSIEDELTVLTREEFSNHPPVLSLSGLFYEDDLPYTYEEYTEHLRQTKEFAEGRPNYTVKLTNTNAFRNIQINIHEGQWAMVSKGKSPAIHFVIRHPKLRSALENMIVLVEG